MFCGKVKEFLSQNKIGFKDRKVAADEAALADLEKLGYMTTQVTLVDGEVVVGFDRARLQRGRKLLSPGETGPVSVARRKDFFSASSPGQSI